jgi:malate dehydrogenase (oxaloacetate-decarboxylating)(NADP+)
LLNGLKVVGKQIGESQTGRLRRRCAAALACLDMLVGLGVKMENIIVTDILGVVYAGRTEEMDDNKARFMRWKTAARTWPKSSPVPMYSLDCRQAAY